MYRNRPSPLFCGASSRRSFRTRSPARFSRCRPRSWPTPRPRVPPSCVLAISALPAGERSAFLLTRVARLSVAAAAEALGVSETEVRRRLVRALESLLGLLRPILEVSDLFAGAGGGRRSGSRGDPDPADRRAAASDLRRAPRAVVDPASAAQGGHAPVVAHLEECAACRSAARDYAALDRLIRPVTPSEPAPDLEARLRQRLSARPGSARKSAWLLAGAVAVLALVAFVAPRLLRGRSAPSTAMEPFPPHRPPRGRRARAAARARLLRRTSSPCIRRRSPSRRFPDRAGKVRGRGYSRLRCSQFDPDACAPARSSPEPSTTARRPGGGSRGHRYPGRAHRPFLDWRRTPEREQLSTLDGVPEPPGRGTHAPRGPLDVHARFAAGGG